MQWDLHLPRFVMLFLIYLRELELIKEILASDRGINAGLVFISSAQNKIKLGAMNPIYSKVLEIVHEIKEKFSLSIHGKL